MKRWNASLLTSLTMFIGLSPSVTPAAECIRASDTLEASHKYAECLAAELAAVRALMGDRVEALVREIDALRASDEALREEIKSARDSAINASRVWKATGRCEEGREIYSLGGMPSTAICQRQ